MYDARTHSRYLTQDYSSSAAWGAEGRGELKQCSALAEFADFGCGKSQP
jgi:hypothetical protein